nr:CopD family protein [Gemmatimonadaceae bacterium]
GRGSKAAWTFAAFAALVLAFTPALSGHAASAPRLTALAILSDGLHIIGAGGWIGSLFIVLIAGIPAAMQLSEEERGGGVAEVINAFSRTALFFAGISVATGVFAAWLHIGTVSGLWQTGYGKTLLLKLGILSLVAATGAYNWLRVRPSLGDVVGGQRIRRSATVEVAIALVVLAVTAVLVATPTAMDERMMTGDSAAALSSERQSTSGYMPR